MKKILVLLFVIFLIGTVGYLLLRFYFLKAPDFKADLSKSKSIIDLRPAIIAKLRQMVKDGLNGLYKLSIDDIELDLPGSRLVLTNATLTVDSFVLKRFDSMHLVPDEVFHITLRSLYITGIGNNYHADGGITMLYDNLGIFTLKKDKQESCNLKKGRYLVLLPILFLLRTAIPTKKEIRQALSFQLTGATAAVF